jgi:2-iminobutanoate/2-iminopropanoate deaminase
VKKIIHTDKAPAAIGPYSQAVEVDGIIFTSGQIPLTPSGELITDFKPAARQVFENLKAVLEAAGSGLDKVFKTVAFLENLDNFALLNEVYSEYFTGDFPARSAVQAARLPRNAVVEIEAMAEKNILA